MNLGFANAFTGQFWGKCHLQQGRVHHATIDIPAHEFMPLRWIGLQTYRDEERPRVRVGRADPQMGKEPYPIVKGVHDRMRTLKPTTTGKDCRPEI